MSSRLGARLAALSIAQVVSWGVLYYAAIVAAPVIADQTGWSLVEVTGLFSLGLVVSALTGIVVGRVLDVRGPRHVMRLGSIVAVVGFATVALAPNLVLFAFGLGGGGARAVRGALPSGLHGDHSTVR